MSDITGTFTDIKVKTVAIVKFGPLSATDGFRPAEYFPVTIDPEKISPSGDYIRFGLNDGDEILGWQRVAALSIVEILGEWDGDTKPTLFYGDKDGVTMLVAD